MASITVIAGTGAAEAVTAAACSSVGRAVGVGSGEAVVAGADSDPATCD